MSLSILSKGHSPYQTGSSSSEHLTPRKKTGGTGGSKGNRNAWTGGAGGSKGNRNAPTMKSSEEETVGKIIKEKGAEKRVVTF